MSEKCQGLSGKPFGNLTVVARVGSDKKGRTLWLCRCIQCGKETNRTRQNLLEPGRRLCKGCPKQLFRLPERPHYDGMLERCYGTNEHNMRNHGGRGIGAAIAVALAPPCVLKPCNASR